MLREVLRRCIPYLLCTCVLIFIILSAMQFQTSDSDNHQVNARNGLQENQVMEAAGKVKEKIQSKENEGEVAKVIAQHGANRK